MSIPSEKTIKDRLNWLGKVGDPDMLAQQIRSELESLRCPTKYSRPGDWMIKASLDNLNVLLQCHGVEYIAHKDDDQHNHYGIDYLNTGDTYIPTICYNHKTHSVIISSWGDIVEKHMNWYP